MYLWAELGCSTPDRVGELMAKRTNTLTDLKQSQEY